MKTEATKMADVPEDVIIADPHCSSTTFLSNVVRGFAASGMFLVGAMPRPRVPNTDMGTDWDAIGGDFRAAISKYAGRIG
jgi:hypothetical protein